MKKIIMVPTWRCNLSCTYCDYTPEGDAVECFSKRHEFGDALSAETWLKELARFAPYKLEFTGGEPTAYAGFVDLVGGVGNSNCWSITSNTLLTKVIEKIDFTHCADWTASYHYHNDDVFVNNCLYILDKIRHNHAVPRVTMVLTPDNKDMLLDKVEMFAANKLPVNVHPMLKEGFSWDDHREIYESVKAICTSPMRAFIDDIPDHFAGDHNETCSAGRNYFMLLPDGRVWRCYSVILDETLAGTSPFIWDYKPTDGECNIDCMFPCDRQVHRGDLQ